MSTAPRSSTETSAQVNRTPDIVEEVVPLERWGRELASSGSYGWEAASETRQRYQAMEDLRDEVVRISAGMKDTQRRSRASTLYSQLIEVARDTGYDVFLDHEDRIVATPEQLYELTVGWADRYGEEWIEGMPEVATGGRDADLAREFYQEHPDLIVDQAQLLAQEYNPTFFSILGEVEIGGDAGEGFFGNHPYISTFLKVTTVTGLFAGGLTAFADFDNDELATWEEFQYGTGIRNSDTDGDGVLDGVEVDSYGTDPLESDTDGDGVLDGVEVDSYGTDPLEPEPEITEIHGMLVSDGEITRNDASYVRFLLDHEHPIDADYSRWGQLSDLGLLYGIPEDGDVTDEEMLLIQNNDGDVLLNVMENELGTNTTSADSDGDGFRDDYEVYLDESLPGADPNVKDVYVEVDRMEGVPPLDEKAVKRIKQDFATSPVDDGKGIHVHFIYDDVVPARDTVNAEYRQVGELNDYKDYYKTFFDNRGRGYHHLMLVNELRFGKQGDIDRGKECSSGSAGLGNFIVGGPGDCGWRGSMTEHEFGHSLGLSKDNTGFEGIDSEKIPYSQYPSVMNYNAVNRPDVGTSELYGFSNGTHGSNDFDDWGFIEENMYTPPTQNLALKSDSVPS